MKKKNIAKAVVAITIPLFVLSSLYLNFNMKSTDINQGRGYMDDSNSVDSNQVPYISTYYIKPVVTTTEDVILDFYITDYNHTSYVEESTEDTFTVTVKIDGRSDIVKKDLKGGDHSINLGKFTNLGEQKFSIICTDQYGRNSHELFNYFLVKNSTTIKEYTMTNKDLKKYNINNKNDKSKGVNNSIGLQKLLDDKKAQGYNKVKLLPGTYTVDYQYTLYIPTQFTLDLNQATIKLNGFTGSGALMIDLNNTFDSHVINGTIEGDYFEHDYTNSPNNSEWVNGINIGGESKYSSFENLIVKNITGYGGTNGIANSRDGKLGYTYNGSIAIGNTFKLGDVDRTTGQSITSDNRTTSDFIDIKNHNQVGYLSVSRYLGYQGNGCSTWNLIVHYYDINKNFIKSTDGYQYRRIEVPKNAKYMKVTILGEDYPTDLSVQYFRIPTHCSFKNITFENCRAVGLAQNAMKDMLVENVTFINCGQKLAKCAYDAEDGWDMMQDVTFRKLNFKDNPNAEFLTCAGHNFVLEDSSCKIYIWGKTRNITIRNNEIKGARIHNDGIVRSGVPRFINNTLTQPLTFTNKDNSITNSIIRDCTLLNTAANCNIIDSTLDIPSGFLNNIKLYKCSIKNIGTYINDLVYFDECIFTSDNEKSSNLKFNVANGYREFNNCTFYGKTLLTGNYFGKGLFNNCTFENVNLNTNTANNINDLVFTNCKMSYTGTNFIAISNSSNITFNNCNITESTSNTITSLVYLKQEPSSGQTIFNNCTINKYKGYVLDGYYNPGYVNKSASYEVLLNKSPLNISLLSNKYNNASLELYKVIVK